MIVWAFFQILKSSVAAVKSMQEDASPILVFEILCSSLIFVANFQRKRSDLQVMCLPFYCIAMECLS